MRQRQLAEKALQMRQLYRQNDLAEKVQQRMELMGETFAQARDHVCAEESTPEAEADFQRRFATERREAAEVIAESDRNIGRMQGTVQRVSRRFGVDPYAMRGADRDTLSSDVLDAAYEGNESTFERGLTGVIARQHPERVVELHERGEIPTHEFNRMILETGAPTAEEIERRKYDAMSLEELDRELVKSAAKSDVQNPVPGVTFTPVRK